MCFMTSGMFSGLSQPTYQDWQREFEQTVFSASARFPRRITACYVWMREEPNDQGIIDVIGSRIYDGAAILSAVFFFRDIDSRSLYYAGPTTRQPPPQTCSTKT